MAKPAVNWTPDLFRERSLVTADGCWLWRRAMRRDGYGHLRVNGRYVGAHRHSYVIAKGAIPPGLHIDHLCNTRACVNPDHLEAVTRGENLRRAWARGRRVHWAHR